MAERDSTLIYASCSICTQIYIKPAVLRCGHTFCEDCLLRWLNLRRVCPHCRKRVAKCYKPIVLSGWEDHLESLALLLPKEDQEERRATKRQRQETGKELKSAKQRRRRNAVVESLHDAVDNEENETRLFDYQHHSEPVEALDDDSVDEMDPQSEAIDESEWEELEQDSDEEASNNVEDNNDNMAYTAHSDSPNLPLYANTAIPTQWGTTHFYFLRSMSDTMHNLSQQMIPPSIYQTMPARSRSNEFDDEEDEDDL